MSVIPINCVTSFGPFRLHPKQRLLLDGGQPVRAGSRVMDILICLVERAGELVSKDELMNRVWPGMTVEELNIRVQMSTLRHLLADRRNGNRYILTIPGRGYCFVAPIASRYGASTAVMSSIPATGYWSVPTTDEARKAQIMMALAPSSTQRDAR